MTVVSCDDLFFIISHGFVLVFPSSVGYFFTFFGLISAPHVFERVNRERGGGGGRERERERERRTDRQTQTERESWRET